MEFSVQRETLLTPLQLISGAVEKKQTLPILSNVLLLIENEQLSLTATDSEVELISRTALDNIMQTGATTVPARKLIDICRSLPENESLKLTLKDNNLLINAGRSRFSLTTLPISDFPFIEKTPMKKSFSFSQKQLRHWIEKTYFSMAQQDVRYYLNGILFHVERDNIKMVATDGHRLALCSDKLETPTEHDVKVILPRKGVMELLRLLNHSDDKVTLEIDEHHVRVSSPEFTFTSKLIDGRFPDYHQVIPKSEGCPAYINCEQLKQVLARVAILSHDKYRGVRLVFDNNLVKIFTYNSEKETAEEELSIEYLHEKIEIGFNVNYLQDALHAIDTLNVRINLIDANSSVIVEADKREGKAEEVSSDDIYVIMPMRL